MENEIKKQFKYENKLIHYRKIGKGKPVFLIHGFGEDSNVWRNQVPYLAANFQLIIPDLPGTGDSEIIPDMSMEGMAALIHAIIMEEKMESCTVIGHSMGGYITMALADKYPEHISKIGLFHSSAFADSEEKKASRKKGIAFIKEQGAAEFLKTMIPGLFAPAKKGQKPACIDEQMAGIHNFSADVLVSYYDAMISRPDRTHVLRKTRLPLLFVMGKSDAAVPVEDVLRQCHLPGKSYIHMLHHSGHMGMLEEPVKTNTLLKEFLMDN